MEIIDEPDSSQKGQTQGTVASIVTAEQYSILLNQLQQTQVQLQTALAVSTQQTKPIKEMATSAKDKFHEKAEQLMDNIILHLNSHNQYQNLQELSSVDEFQIWYNVPVNNAAHDRIQLWF